MAAECKEPASFLWRAGCRLGFVYPHMRHEEEEGLHWGLLTGPSARLVFFGRICHTVANVDYVVSAHGEHNGSYQSHSAVKMRL